MCSPLLVQVEPTTRCNFKCGFCPRHHLDQGDLDLDVFAKIINDFNEICCLQLYGEGEPFLHPDYFSMVQIANEKKINISTISNGSLIDKVLDEIMSSAIISIHVSLESSDPATFKKIRGGDVVKIENNLIQLNTLKKKYNKQSPLIGLSVTVLNDTQSDLDNIFDFYDRLQMNAGIIIQPLNKMSSYADNYDLAIEHQGLNDNQLLCINQFLESNEKLRKIQKEKLLHQTFFEKLRHGVVVKNDGCPWLARGFFVNFKGFVMPCSMIKDENRFAFGRIGVNSAKEILSRRDAMKQQFFSGCIPLSCKNCRTLDVDYVPGRMHRYIA